MANHQANELHQAWRQDLRERWQLPLQQEVPLLVRAARHTSLHGIARGARACGPVRVFRGTVQSTPITDEPLSTHSRVNTPLPAAWRWARARMQRIHDVRAQAGREASRHGEVR